MNLEIKFFDVNLGNCVYIKTPNGLNILFDLGSKEDFSIINGIKSRGETLDCLIISHPHKDHIEDLININDTFKPEVLVRNKLIPEELIKDSIQKATSEKDKQIFKKYLYLNREYNKPVSISEDPIQSNNNGGVQFHFFTPSFKDNSDLNDYSMAVLVSYHSYKILLMGDNTLPNISEIMDNKYFLDKIKDVDILLAPHHGRDTSWDVDFVNYVNPGLTIISDKSNTSEVSASTKYSNKSRGLNVVKGPFKPKERKCLTTREDGEITVRIYDDLEIFIN